MARNLLQDMVKNKTSGRVPAKSLEKKEILESFLSARESLKYNNKNPNKISKKSIYLTALVSVVFLLFALSFLFSLAKITVNPKIREIPLNGNFSAVKDSSIDGPSFELVAISGEERKSILGGDIKDVTTKALGTVIIYNSFSSVTQNLDIDTRLEGSNGKIYKTVKKVTVPGVKKDGKPGSVEVDIYAAEAGEEYNNGPIDFKIFGFKGTAKYAKFYARSKDSIVGGFKGKLPALSLLDRTTIVSALEETLREKLLKQAVSQTPPGFVLFPDGVFLEVSDKDISFVPEKDNFISVSLKGTFLGFIFDEKKLTKEIVETVVDDYNGSEVYIPNIKNLSFVLNDKENISFAEAKSIKFTLTGKPEIIWKVDESKLVNNILGRKKKDFNQILSQFVSVDSAELVLRPFWKTHFPEQSKNIEMIVNYPIY